MTVPSVVFRPHPFAKPAAWRRVARLWAVIVVVAATVIAGPALAVTKTVNGISLDINMPQAQRGVQYAFQLAPSGRTAPYTFQILSGALPAAFSMSSAGLVTGVNCVSTNGTYNVAVRVTSADGNSADFTTNQSVSINMTAGPAGSCALTGGSITSSGSSPEVGQYYSATISASGGSAPYTYSVVTGALPTGLSLSSSGTISGTPTAAGSFDFQIQSADSAGNTGYTQYALAVAAASSVAVSPTSLPTPLLNTAYSQAISAAGGASPYAFTVSAGALPTGLSLNSSSGVISGTPTAAGAYSFTIRATDAGSLTGARSYNGAIAAALAVATTTLPTPVLSQAYSQTVATSGGTAPVTFVISGGSLPAGLSLNTSTGAITGTPTAAGAYSFTIQATDANGVTATRAFSGAIADALAITTTSLPTPILTQAYGQIVATSGGTAPVTFAISAGSLPTGLSLDTSTGAMTGTPTAAGAYSFTVRATDANSVTVDQAYSGAITAALAITTTTLPTPVLNAAYIQTVATSGGAAPVTFAISAGSLPSGLSLNTSTGAITGTPTAPGAYSFTIEAADANGVTATQGYSGAISSGVVITTTAVPTPVLGVAYSQTIATSNGAAPVTFAVSAGSLPSGLSLNASTGALTGTPTTAGAYSFTVQATDSNSATDAATYGGTIASGLAITATSLPTPVLNQAYSQTVLSSGGAAPVTFAVSAGSLPTGLSLNTSTGAITGTPTAAGTYSFTVQATDNNSITATQAYSGVIASGLAITTTSLATPILSRAYSQAVASSGGAAPVTFAVSAGSLPTGLSLNASTGAIAGTPTAPGAYGFTIQAVDANGVTATRAFSGTIAAALTISTGGLPTPVLGVAYSGGVAASGGTAPVTFAISSGGLPAGLSLDGQTGAISGAPTTAGPYGFTVQATDALNVTATQAYSGEIAAALVITTRDLGAAIAGQAYAAAVAATGGKAPYAFTASGLPAGLAMDAGGAISGTPTTAGAYAITAQAVDADGARASQTLALNVAVAVTVSDQSIDVPYNTAATITLATLNPGDALELQSSPANGKVSQVGPIVEYVPNAGYIGADGFGFAIKGAWGQTRTASVRLNVLPPPPPTAEPPPSTTLDTTGPTGGTGAAGGAAAVVVEKVNFNLASLVKGIVTDVQIATPPKHGKVELVRTATLVAARAVAERLCAAAAPAVPEITAIYTADKGYVGRDSFTFVAIGPGGVSAPATVNIEVIKSTPTAPVLKVKAMGGRKVTVDLTAAATDGPFLGAALVATPAASIGAARLVEGGSAGARTYALEFTPKGAFTGDVAFTYTLTNSSGVSDPLTVILTIEARQDPTADATVRAINDAQTEAARRFTGAQLDNFGRRLESLHGGRTGDGFGLNLASGVGQADDCRLRARTPDAERACHEKAATTATPGAAPSQRPIGKVEVWTGGAITVGRRDADTRLAKLTVQTSGISGGADVRLSSMATVGVGGGYASDITKLSGDKGRVDADGWTAATYASLHPASGVFVDVVAGVGQLTFDTRRTTAASGERVVGQRDAALRFGSLTAGYDGMVRLATWSLYLRAKALNATLDAYAERGSDAYALAYDKRRLNSLVGVIGGRVQFDRDLGEVRVTPRVRIEVSHEFASVDPQRLRYADWLDGASYQLAGDAWAADRVTLGVGSGFGFDNGWSLDLDLGAELAKRQSSATARVGAAKRF